MCLNLKGKKEGEKRKQKRKKKLKRYEQRKEIEKSQTEKDPNESNGHMERIPKEAIKIRKNKDIVFWPK